MGDETDIQEIYEQDKDDNQIQQPSEQLVVVARFNCSFPSAGLAILSESSGQVGTPSGKDQK